MTGPAVDARPPMAAVGGQQPLQEAAADAGHCGADRQLHSLQAPAGRQRARRRLG
jgi:hypothetical protein